MKDRISDELMRSDLTTQIQAAISDAITFYQKSSLRFNRTFTATFQTTVGTQFYNALTDANFPAVTSFRQFYSIDWVLCSVPPMNIKLQRQSMEWLLLISQQGTQQGFPLNFAFQNETLGLYPIPSSSGPGQIQAFSLLNNGTGYISGSYTLVPLTGGTGSSATANIIVVGGAIISVQLVNPGAGYSINDILSATTLGPGANFQVQVLTTFSAQQGPYQITVGGQVTYPAPASDTETGNKWMTDCELLIRSRAKYQIAQHVTRNNQMALAMSPEEPGQGQQPGATYEAFRRLTIEANRMERTGRIYPMQF